MDGSLEGEHPPIVTDTCVLINFSHISRLDLLCRHSGYRIVVTEHVRAELLDPAQARLLNAAIDEGIVEEISITDPAELTIFAERAPRRHGEISVPSRSSAR